MFKIDESKLYILLYFKKNDLVKFETIVTIISYFIFLNVPYVLATDERTYLKCVIVKCNTAVSPGKMFTSGIDLVDLSELASVVYSGIHSCIVFDNMLKE